MVKIYSIILFSFFVLFVPFSISAANLSISPTSGTFEVGERVVLRVMATGDTPFNAISGDVLFPPSIFSIESVSKTNSILNFWVVEPTFLKSVGSVKFEGVTLGGFQGTTGTVVTVNLRAIKSGSGRVSFRLGQVLANNGEGTDITGDLVGATFSVKDATRPPVKESVLIEKEEPQPEPTLEAPEIVTGTKYGARAIIGSSDYPKAEALMTFTALDGVKVFITDTALTDGSFSLVIPNSLKRGQYSVTAVMVKDDKTNSRTSNMLIIQIGNIFSDISFGLWLIIIILILLVVYLLLRIYFHFKKDKITRQNIENETDEAEKVTHRSFDILRDDINSYEHEKLSTKEQRIISGIKKDINEAEKTINKEIKDIESV